MAGRTGEFVILPFGDIKQARGVPRAYIIIGMKNISGVHKIDVPQIPGRCMRKNIDVPVVLCMKTFFFAQGGHWLGRFTNGPYK